MRGHPGLLVTPLVLAVWLAAPAMAKAPSWTEIVLQPAIRVESVPGLTRPLLAPSAPITTGTQASAVPTTSDCLRTWNRHLPRETRAWMRDHAKGAPALATIWRSHAQAVGRPAPPVTIAQCAYAVGLGEQDLVLVTAPAAWEIDGEWSGQRERLRAPRDRAQLSRRFPARITTTGGMKRSA